VLSGGYLCVLIIFCPAFHWTVDIDGTLIERGGTN